ncbi:MAG: glycosyltransferase family 4 protein, partial [Anaerolineae bacterium]
LIREIAPDVIMLHAVYEPEVIRDAGALAPTVAYIHTFYAACPGLVKLFKRGEEICRQPFGLGCVPMIYLRRCASARHPRSVARILSRTAAIRAAYVALPRLIVGSPYMRDLLVQNRYPAGRISLLPPHFVEVGHAPTDVPNAPTPAGPARTILFVGRLEIEKGLPYLLQALKLIKIPVRLQVVGEGTRGAAYRQLAQDMDLAEQVEFVGWRMGDELDACYQGSTVLAMPFIAPETFGKVGIEALTHGRPVVAFNAGGIPSWLRDGEYGYLIPVKDVSALADRLERILSDEDLAQRMGMRGWEYVRREFAPETHAERLNEIFSRAREDASHD